MPSEKHMEPYTIFYCEHNLLLTDEKYQKTIRVG